MVVEARRGTVAAEEVAQLAAGLAKGKNKRGQRQAGEVDG